MVYFYLVWWFNCFAICLLLISITGNKNTLIPNKNMMVKPELTVKYGDGE